jgi:hypothetical protein
MLGQEREHAARRHQLPDHHLRVQQFPIHPRLTLHSKIISGHRTRGRQTRRPHGELFSEVFSPGLLV